MTTTIRGLKKVQSHVEEALRQAEKADDSHAPSPIGNLILAVGQLAEAIQELARHNEMLEAVTGRML